MPVKTRSKRYLKCQEKQPSGRLPLAEAVKVVKSFTPTKFDATVDLVMHLGIDPKQADQALRGAFSLPHGIGKSRKVIAFCDGDNIGKAKAAGAVEAGADDLIKKINDGWTDFDVAVATPGMMKSVSKLGRVLGPTGKMPSPKAGTVVEDIPKAVQEYAAGKVEYRNDDGGNVHVAVGKFSFDEQKLVENIDAFINLVKRLRPSSVKGIYIKKVSISASMTPGVEVAAD
ncbi:MAG: 50S ribosomal protein L1 [Planctomycetes bacterium]|nr:50S ribosomal protein L1 [Planctomycetota bacterium]